MIRNEGKYKDTAVVIKRLKKDSVIDTLSLRKEVKEMRDLKHPNVSNFIGACLESPNVAILIELAGKVNSSFICVNLLFICLFVCVGVS